MTVLTKRLNTETGCRLVREGGAMTESEKERFGKSAMIRYVSGIDQPIYPIASVSYTHLDVYKRQCDDNAQKPMSANRVSSELAQNERLYNVEATNNVHVGGKRVRGFVGIEVINPPPY